MDKTEKYYNRPTTNDTRLALLDALAELQCKTAIQEDGTIWAWHNGRSLICSMQNNFVRIHDLYWRTFCPGDAEIPYFREAVNAANSGGLATIIFTYSDDGLIFLHSHSDFFMDPQIPYQDVFVKAYLKALDRIKESFDTHLKALNR